MSLGFRGIHGVFVPLGTQPDGDSLRFAPDDPSAFEALQGGYRVPWHRNKTDGSVQLRLEAIDATELHHGQARQNLAEPARVDLLRLQRVRYAADGMTVASSSAPTTTGVVLAKLADPNGRVVSYVLPARHADGLPEGWHIIDAPVLEKTRTTVCSSPARSTARSVEKT